MINMVVNLINEQSEYLILDCTIIELPDPRMKLIESFLCENSLNTDDLIVVVFS